MSLIKKIKAKFSHRIYLDNASTTPVSNKIVKVLKNASEIFGNPGSIHKEGVMARSLLRGAKNDISSIIKSQPDEIIFTSGTTEANNIAILGVVNKYRKIIGGFNGEGKKIHIVTTEFEHHSVLRLIKDLEKEGVLVTYVKPDSSGIIDPLAIKKSLRDETVLVSVMYAQNEIGVIQPIREIAKVIRQFKIDAVKRGVLASDILFHIDAAQAPAFLTLNVNELHADLISLGAHKFYGPKGIGILFKRRPVILAPILLGGNQERGIRPGTENVPGAIAMAQALIEADKLREKESTRLTKIRDYFFTELHKYIPEAVINGDKTNRLPNNINISIPGMDGEVIVLELDARGIAVSTGSACTTDEIGPSHVLLSLGLTREVAVGSIRISMGRSSTKRDLLYVLKCLKEINEKYKQVISNQK